MLSSLAVPECKSGFKQGGAGGALKATVGQPAKDMAAAASAPMRDAYREGSAYGLRATGGGSGAGTSSSRSRGGASSSEPDWARKIRRREQITRAGTVASQAVREGDRGSASEGPDLNPNS